MLTLQIAYLTLDSSSTPLRKLKAMGFSGVSFYTCWGLLEGNPGYVIIDGIFALEESFIAAIEAGIFS